MIRRNYVPHDSPGSPVHRIGILRASMAVLRPGDGERLFGGRIVLLARYDDLSVTESHFAEARDGAAPHLHERHADSFYVLEGELAVLVHDREVLVGAGGCVCAPPGV